MKVKTGHAHVLDIPGFVELGENGTHLVHQIGTNAARVILLKKAFSGPCGESPLSDRTVARIASRVKWNLRTKLKRLH
jgi:hypothetical protein